MVDGAEKLEKARAMLWELGKVLVDHAERALKRGVEDGRDLIGEKRAKTSDDRRHNVENLGVAGRRDILVIIAENGIEEAWNEARGDLL